MSRLDSFIRRLEAQRACLNAAAEAIREVSGIVFELGLGNGRTYDHLRHLLAGRRIVVFERDPQPHPACRPPSGDLIVGDLEQTLLAGQPEWAGAVALIHSDIGTGDAARNRRVATVLARLLPPFLTTGGLVLSDQPLPDTDLETLPAPAGISAGRYFLYRRGGGGQ